MTFQKLLISGIHATYELLEEPGFRNPIDWIKGKFGKDKKEAQDKSDKKTQETVLNGKDKANFNTEVSNKVASIVADTLALLKKMDPTLTGLTNRSYVQELLKKDTKASAKVYDGKKFIVNFDNEDSRDFVVALIKDARSHIADVKKYKAHKESMIDADVLEDKVNELAAVVAELADLHNKTERKELDMERRDLKDLKKSINKELGAGLEEIISKDDVLTEVFAQEPTVELLGVTLLDYSGDANTGYTLTAKYGEMTGKIKLDKNRQVIASQEIVFTQKGKDDVTYVIGSDGALIEKSSEPVDAMDDFEYYFDFGDTGVELASATKSQGQGSEISYKLTFKKGSDESGEVVFDSAKDPAAEEFKIGTETYTITWREGDSDAIGSYEGQYVIAEKNSSTKGSEEGGEEVDLAKFDENIDVDDTEQRNALKEKILGATPAEVAARLQQYADGLGEGSTDWIPGKEAAWKNKKDIATLWLQKGLLELAKKNPGNMLIATSYDDNDTPGQFDDDSADHVQRSDGKWEKVDDANYVFKESDRVSGDFGNTTFDAVRNFQLSKKKTLKNDGFAGVNTLGAMVEELLGADKNDQNLDPNGALEDPQFEKFDKTIVVLQDRRDATWPEGVDPKAKELFDDIVAHPNSYKNLVKDPENGTGKGYHVEQYITIQDFSQKNGHWSVGYDGLNGKISPTDDHSEVTIDYYGSEGTLTKQYVIASDKTVTETVLDATV